MLFSGRDKKEQKIEQLLLENYNSYYRLAYSYVHNESDASDIVQNGAYRAILHSDTLRQEKYAATWLYRIMLNENVNTIKSRLYRGLKKLRVEFSDD